MSSKSESVEQGSLSPVTKAATAKQRNSSAGRRRGWSGEPILNTTQDASSQHNCQESLGRVEVRQPADLEGFDQKLRVGIVSGEGCADTCVEALHRALTTASMDVTEVEITRVAVLLPGIDILIMPGGGEGKNDGYGIGQRAALGIYGREAICSALFTGNMSMYIGICAGAFLAIDRQTHKDGRRMNLNLVDSAVRVFDSKHFGQGDLTGNVILDCKPALKPVVDIWNKSGGAWYDQSLVMDVPHGLERVHVLMTYAAPVRAKRCRPPASYTKEIAAFIVGKAACIMTEFGAGRVCLMGPHLEFTGSSATADATVPLLLSILTNIPPIKSSSLQTDRAV